MASPAQKVQLSFEDVLSLERETELRHEYLNGEAWAMAGGTAAHATIMLNLQSFLRVALRGRPCRVFNSEYRIRVPATGLATYPDASVICGPPQEEPGFPNAASNPVLLAEVLSPSTEAWDRGGKFAHCRRIPTLRYFLLVSQDPPRVELFTRTDEGSWTLTEHGPGEVVPLAELDLSLPVDALFEDVEVVGAGAEG